MKPTTDAILILDYLPRTGVCTIRCVLLQSSDEETLLGSANCSELKLEPLSKPTPALLNRLFRNRETPAPTRNPDVSGPKRDLKEVLIEQCEAGHRRVLLDFSEVGQVSSTGVGHVVAVYKEVTRWGGRLILVGVSDRASVIFRMAKIEQLFEMVGTRSEAIQRLREWEPDVALP